MKYTNSQDGIDRLTLHFSVRLSKQDIDEMRPLAKAQGYTSVTKWLRDFAAVAVHDWVDNQWENLSDDDKEQK